MPRYRRVWPRGSVARAMASDASVREPAGPREVVHSSSAAARPLPTSNATYYRLKSFRLKRLTKVFKQSAADASPS